MLSHFTSEQGLIGIVRSQTLWATEFLTLNDNVEFIYASSILFQDALSEIIQLIPSDLLVKDKAHEFQAGFEKEYYKKLKDYVRNSNGYGNLFVTSFSKLNDDMKARKELLWERYTKHRGYCLEFALKDVRHVIEHEQMRHSYFSIQIVDVIYGIDKRAKNFLFLIEQIKRFIMKLLFDQTNERRFLEFCGPVDENQFFREFLIFCGSHKDPIHSEEGETRILAYPAPNAEFRPLIGMGHPKTIHQATHVKGRRYIKIGDTRIPGLIPKQIIKGFQAELKSYYLDALYPPMPVIKSYVFE